MHICLCAYVFVGMCMLSVLFGLVVAELRYDLMLRQRSGKQWVSCVVCAAARYMCICFTEGSRRCSLRVYRIMRIIVHFGSFWYP